MSEFNFENKNFTSNGTFTDDLTPSRILEIIRQCFEFRNRNFVFDTESFTKFFNREQKIRIELTERDIQKLKKLGIRIITRANFYRTQALRVANCNSEIKPHTKEHSEISNLFIPLPTLKTYLENRFSIFQSLSPIVNPGGTQGFLSHGI